MPAMKSKILSAFAWAVPALAAVLPTRDINLARSDGKPSLLKLDVQETYAQATFNIPCPGCLGEEGTSHDDDAFLLNFRTHSSDDSCGSSNITLNGAYLPQEWHGDFASGSGTFSSVTDLQENDWFLQHDLDLEWNSTCLQDNISNNERVSRDAAQVLTVTIKGIDGRSIGKPAGFTISFKQQTSPPELLRLQATPDLSASDEANADDWRDPPSHLRLTLSSVQKENTTTEASLEDEIRELKALQAELQQLQDAIREKKKSIHSQLNKEAHSFKEELKQCDSITCFIKTIAHKAHGAVHLVYVRLRPDHHPHGMGGANDPYAQVWRAGSHRGGHEAAIKIGHGSMIESIPAPPRPSTSQATHELPPRPPPRDSSHQSAYIVALKIIVGVLCCGCIVTVIRHRCCSERCKSDRAALREERANARAFRRAARQHAWRNWWRGNWRSLDRERISDYEEKRALISSQESVLEEAMQEEIRQLRDAHGIVNSLVQAPTLEEGRFHPHVSCHGGLHCYCHEPPSPTSTAYTSNSMAELPSRPLSRTSSLPSYRSDPPDYETDEDVSDIVPNGFRQYSPSTISDGGRWTPDSSVVDVSPRPSAETLRYAETTDTGVGNEKN